MRYRLRTLLIHLTNAVAIVLAAFLVALAFAIAAVALTIDWGRFAIPVS
jgi:hypothetical protein